MKASTPRFLALLLVVWGLFSMGFPLWYVTQVAQSEGVLADISMSQVAIGLTAVIAGLALYMVCARIDELAKELRLLSRRTVE